MPRPRPDTSVEKKCYTCQQVKPIAEFYRSRRSYDGLQGRCKRCQIDSANAWRKEDPARHAANARRWAKKNPRSVRNSYLKRVYGITIDDYEAMLAKQGGGCAICGAKKTGRAIYSFHVDHCHDTTTIRGLLCSTCNTGIGQLNHDVSRLQAAIDYLNRSSSRTQR